MTGMKEGAGEDPFADEADSSADSQGADEPEESGENDSSTESSGERQRGGQQTMQIPYRFRRDGVQDGRDRVPLFLHPETKSAERDALRELEDRFDDSVSLTDLREALMMVGLDRLDEVELQLEEWGYGMTFD